MTVGVQRKTRIVTETGAQMARKTAITTANSLRKGWLGVGQLLRVPADKETDPFWVDEFKLNLTAERTTVHFRECARLTATVQNKGGLPVEEAQVEFQMQPRIASFATGGGSAVTTAFVQTDKDGKAATDFCALETEGTVTITALYKPCPEGAESKAELQIQIRPYDWVFAVQEKAVLTGPEVINDQGLTLRVGAYSLVFNAYCKESMAWAPDAPWTVVDLGDGAAYSRYDIEADLLGAGPPQPPAFLDDFRFKRDYIKSELQELEQRKLAAPQYEIRMLTKDN